MKILIRRTTPSVIFVVISFFMIFFQYNIQPLFRYITYYDEAFPILLIILYLFKRKFSFFKSDKILLILLIGIFFVGYIGNLNSGFNNRIYLIGIDYVGIIKCLLTYIFLKNLLSKKEIEDTIDIIALFLQIYVFIALICYFFASIFDWDWMFKQERFGIGTFGFIHGYAGDGWMGYFLEISCCFFAMSNRIKYRIITLISAIFLCIMTLKGPSLLFCVFIIYFYYFIKGNKLSNVQIITTILIGACAGSWFINRYLLTPGEARFYLNAYGLKISLDKFPIGLGFGTFGSDISRDFYSPAYTLYGLNNFHGLGAHGNVSYITDTYWGMILGQLGFIGVAIMAYVYYSIFLTINRAKGKKLSKSIILAMFFSLMAGSLGSAYLTSYIGLLCFFTIGLYVKYNE